ncbi:hypothetical protein [Flavobacterium gilvum]|uniref:YhhN-like protein n=1 Tax=Flavobacterium gilvum TaxID=1492737 RepID=A0AAC9N7A5_9FLAO|nr:hypothetical protein [Flavobacterium gilvum]AOW10694.1 hypothetical protein EM308_14990 [Flavobacterium gilvum]KFC60316.1 hypothetical protein FEM08_09230 [Flavobacterium gilvum]
MKPSTPSLILFFVTSVLAIIFKLLGYGSLVLIVKSVIIPSLFIYYLVSNDYKITFLKAFIFLLFFVRDVFVMLSISESAMGSFMSVLVVYVLLTYLAIKDFTQLKFSLKDSFYAVVLIIGIATICYSVLNLKLENLELNFYLYVVFGLILSVLSIITVLNYIKNNTYASFSAMLMCINFIISDIFFVLYKFYFYNYLLTLISLITQFLSYFFMVRYFLEKDRKTENLNDY